MHQVRMANFKSLFLKTLKYVLFPTFTWCVHICRKVWVGVNNTECPQTFSYVSAVYCDQLSCALISTMQVESLRYHEGFWLEMAVRCLGQLSQHFVLRLFQWHRRSIIPKNLAPPSQNPLRILEPPQCFWYPLPKREFGVPMQNFLQNLASPCKTPFENLASPWKNSLAFKSYTIITSVTAPLCMITIQQSLITVPLCGFCWKLL